MDPIENPYAPGAGTPPPHLAGRESILENFNTIAGRATAGRPFQHPVLSGLRGVGKTVLLRRFRSMAIERGWAAEVFEVRPGGDLRPQIAETLRPMAREISRKWRNKERAALVGRIMA